MTSLLRCPLFRLTCSHSCRLFLSHFSFPLGFSRQHYPAYKIAPTRPDGKGHFKSYLAPGGTYRKGRLLSPKLCGPRVRCLTSMFGLIRASSREEEDRQATGPFTASASPSTQAMAPVTKGAAWDVPVLYPYAC